MLTGVALVAAPAQAAEIIPSLGMTRSPENSDQTNISYGLAIRSSLAPMVAAEVGMSYRKEELFGGIVESTQWPITGSLWLKPVSMFYVGGGVGWYNTTLSYPNLPILASTTSQDFGIHLGGGLSLPLVPGVASLDLNGRYVYLGNQASELPPNEFNADHWTTTLGLAIGF
jgi:hypothetical protein